MTTKLPPVIFVNPTLFAPMVRIGLVPDALIATGNVSLRNAPIEALTWLAARIGATVVGTAAPLTGTDARDMLSTHGLRATFGPDWFARDDLADRYDSIAGWVTRHGSRRIVVIDSPAPQHGLTQQLPRGAIVMSIGDGVELTRAACERVAAMIDAPAARG